MIPLGSRLRKRSCAGSMMSATAIEPARIAVRPGCDRIESTPVIARSRAGVPQRSSESRAIPDGFAAPATRVRRRGGPLRGRISGDEAHHDGAARLDLRELPHIRERTGKDIAPTRKPRLVALGDGRAPEADGDR